MLHNFIFNGSLVSNTRKFVNGGVLSSDDKKNISEFIKTIENEVQSKNPIKKPRELFFGDSEVKYKLEWKQDEQDENMYSLRLLRFNDEFKKYVEEDSMRDSMFIIYDKLEDYRDNFYKYAGGGEFGGGGRLNKNDEYAKIEKEMNVLEGKRAKWIGSSEARSILNSPYDEEIAELQKKLDLIEGEAVKKYDIPSVRGMDEKAQKKMAFEFYLLLQKPKSLSKFLNSLTTPLRKKTWDKLQYKSYQNKWGYKVIINKSADTIRVDMKYVKGGGLDVVEGWTDAEKSDAEAQYVKGGGLEQKGKTDKAHDKVYKAKRVGYRYTDERAKKLGLSSNAKPTQEHIDKYLGNGVYKEDRANRSDKSRMKKLNRGGSAGNKSMMQKIQDEVKKLKAEAPNMFKKHTDFVKKAASNLKSKGEL